MKESYQECTDDELAKMLSSIDENRGAILQEQEKRIRILFGSVQGKGEWPIEWEFGGLRVRYNVIAGKPSWSVAVVEEKPESKSAVEELLRRIGVALGPFTHRSVLHDS